MCSVECALELLAVSARGPPPDWLSFLAGLRPAHNDRADRPILRWQACRGQVNVKCSAAILLAHRALPDAIHPLHRRRPVAPPATPELLCLSVAVADEIRFACLCATLVVLRQSLTVAPRNLNAYNPTLWENRSMIAHIQVQAAALASLGCTRCDAVAGARLPAQRRIPAPAIRRLHRSDRSRTGHPLHPAMRWSSSSGTARGCGSAESRRGHSIGRSGRAGTRWCWPTADVALGRVPPVTGVARRIAVVSKS